MVIAMDPCVVKYRELRNLKLVGAALGMPWQTVYTRLKRLGEPVTGDKARYGSEKDRLAARAEGWFAKVVPQAVDSNTLQFQAKTDFTVGLATVDVKVSRRSTTPRGIDQWAWSVKKQEMVADHFVCIALDGAGDDLKLAHVLLIPGEIARHHTTIRLSRGPDGFRGKWSDYAIGVAALRSFFEEVG